MLRPAEAWLLTPGLRTKQAEDEYSQSEDLEKGDESSQGGVLVATSVHRIQKIDASLLEVGDIVRISTGATPPADATIVSSEDSAFDESSLTGESRLIKKTTGDKVFLGTINKSRMVDARVDTHGGATM